MLFRPEEVHGASGVREVVEPLPERNRYVGGHAIGVHAKDRPVTNFYANGESTIEAWTIYTDHFPWKEPADRQRLKSSLSEPLLLTVHANPILGGQIVERSKRGNQACVGEQPARHPGRK